MMIRRVYEVNQIMRPGVLSGILKDEYGVREIPRDVQVDAVVNLRAVTPFAPVYIQLLGHFYKWQWEVDGTEIPEDPASWVLSNVIESAVPRPIGDITFNSISQFTGQLQTFIPRRVRRVEIAIPAEIEPNVWLDVESVEIKYPDGTPGLPESTVETPPETSPEPTPNPAPTPAPAPIPQVPIQAFLSNPVVTGNVDCPNCGHKFIAHHP